MMRWESILLLLGVINFKNLDKR